MPGNYNECGRIKHHCMIASCEGLAGELKLVFMNDTFHGASPTERVFNFHFVHLTCINTFHPYTFYNIYVFDASYQCQDAVLRNRDF